MPPSDESELHMGSIGCHSIFGLRSGKGLVGISIDDRKPIYITPDQARDVAANMLGAATAAETDEIIVVFLTERMQLSMEQAGAVLGELRKLRESRQSTQPR